MAELTPTALKPSLIGPELYDPIRNELEVTQRILEEELAGEFAFINVLCDQVRSYRGKMLRPALLLLSGKATGELSDAHPTLSAVVEMTHIATLVHDDVVDESDERRMRPTVRASDGNVTAVLLGDYLISHAFHLCSSLENMHAARRISSTTNTVCEGELLQNRLRGNDRITETQYLDIIRRKTAVLTAVCCELGACYAGADKVLVEAMYAYGLSAGMAFQIIDDVLDIVGNRLEVGKTLGLDLALGKLTLPTIHCLAHAQPATAASLRAALAGKEACTPERLRGWLTETGSIDYAVSVAGEYVAEAVRRLDFLPPGPHRDDARLSLAAMAEFIVERRF